MAALYGILFPLKWNDIPLFKDDEGVGVSEQAMRPMRPDAQRSQIALLKAALDVFAASGVDAPYRLIAQAAGVGVGTIYRHYPQRSDLIVAVYRQELEACAAAADEFAAEFEPGEALDRWMRRLVDFVNAKRGMVAALHSGDSAYKGLAVLLESTLRPVLQQLLGAASAAGDIRGGVDSWDLLRAASSLATPYSDVEPDHAYRMVALLVDGLRYEHRFS